ncbi:trimethyltridecatetraene synthase-like [Populus alba x Populus x berolinensis]|uniref:Trimethyltridecatetraene synthase-like n=1 Tax=Populus alba x Populus x berolinensis TaxID=444605 RepID=A0AAD6W8K6_9ROSI|nr:trimethyltridecatetraene synthase-like [Populus alba x Populus x berolinensis]KAJ7003263.1 trimethyltridecatetraene synthase-like [Populus alba x Populus x berolinensis]
MELSTFAALLLATVAVITLFRHLTRPKLNLPPGPKPWPIIGNLNLLAGPLPHRNMHALVQKYGPIMQLKFGSYPVVVGSSVEMAEAVLKTNDVKLADRPKIAAGKYTTYNYSNITWSQYGPYWRQARKICLMEIFSPKRLDQFETVRVQELQALLRKLFVSAGKPINARDNFSDLSLSVISRLVLGKNYTVKDGNQKEYMSPKEFKEMIDELFLLNGVLDIGDSIPWLAFLDLQGYIKRMKAVGQLFDGFLEHTLNEHQQRRKGVKNYVPQDMMDILLQLSDDPNLEVQLDRTAVKAFTMDLIAGGTESSAVTTEWAMAELLKKPEYFKRANEELDRVIGRDRWVEERDIVNLPFINAICKETMRLHPVSPFLVPRLAREDIQLGGYDIPKGTRVMVNVWTIGRDASIWEKPHEFCPERFIGKSIDVKGHNFELLPFGAGRRMCVGYSLGLKVIQASVANLLHGFKWKLPGDMTTEELNMQEIFGLSTPKQIPLVAELEPRLPAHMYSM